MGKNGLLSSDHESLQVEFMDPSQANRPDPPQKVNGSALPPTFNGPGPPPKFNGSDHPPKQPVRQVSSGAMLVSNGGTTCRVANP